MLADNSRQSSARVRLRVSLPYILRFCSLPFAITNARAGVLLCAEELSLCS
jgi:hypothetical protein